MPNTTYRSLLTAGILLCASVFLSSCQTKVEPISATRGFEPLPPDLIFQSLAHRQADIRSLKAFVRTSVRGPDLKQSFKQVLLLEGNRAIRLDTYGLFGQALGVFIHNGQGTIIYDVESGRTIHGPKVWDALERMLGIRVDFTRYIEVFSGNIPHLENLKFTDAPLNADKTRYQLTSQDHGTQVDLEVNTSNLLPARMVRHISGQRSVEVRWEDYRKVGDRDFPHQIELMLPGRQTISMVYKETALNTNIAANAFDPPVYGKTSSP